MITRARHLALVIALLVSTAPSFAQDVQPRTDDATPCATAACEPNGVGGPSRDTLGRTLAAEVMSIDESSGQVLLRTELGVVTVPASPAIITQLSVGDVVMLRVVPDDDDFPAASPPSGDRRDAAPRGNRL